MQWEADTHLPPVTTATLPFRSGMSVEGFHCRVAIAGKLTGYQYTRDGIEVKGWKYAKLLRINFYSVKAYLNSRWCSTYAWRIYPVSNL
jgi:hypothetical protein